MNMTRAVLWDMDGTLVDSEELHWISWRDTMAKEGRSITREEFLSSFGQRNDSILSGWLGVGASPERISRIRMPRRSCIVGWFGPMGSDRCPVSEPGFAGFTSAVGSRPLLRPPLERTSKWSSKLSRLPAIFRESSPRKTFTGGSRILKRI